MDQSMARSFSSRPTIYISVILVVTLLGYAYQLRTQFIFACPATWSDWITISPIASQAVTPTMSTGPSGLIQNLQREPLRKTRTSCLLGIAAFRLDFQPPRRRIGSRQHQLGIIYWGSVALRIWFSRKGFSAGSNPKPEST